MAEESARTSGHELSDVSPRLVAQLAAGLAIFLLATPPLLHLLFPGVRGGPAPALSKLPPEPRLQINPQRDLAARRSSEQNDLETYGWIDRSGGTVRVPIDRAMQLITERGIAGWDTQ